MKMKYILMPLAVLALMAGSFFAGSEYTRQRMLEEREAMPSPIPLMTEDGALPTPDPLGPGQIPPTEPPSPEPPTQEPQASTTPETVYFYPQEGDAQAVSPSPSPSPSISPATQPEKPTRPPQPTRPPSSGPGGRMPGGYGSGMQEPEEPTEPPEPTILPENTWQDTTDGLTL